MEAEIERAGSTRRPASHHEKIAGRKEQGCPHRLGQPWRSGSAVYFGTWDRPGSPPLSARRNQPALGADVGQCARAAQRRPAPEEPARPGLPDRGASSGKQGRLVFDRWRRCLLHDLGQGRLTDSPDQEVTMVGRDDEPRRCSRPPDHGHLLVRSASRKQPFLVTNVWQSARAAQRRPAPEEPARPTPPDRDGS